MPRIQQGVVNPQALKIHPYPTRFHGPIYTRPEFGMPYVRAPQSVFMPNDFHDAGTSGLGSLGSTGYGSLGATVVGTKIYWLGAKNARVVAIQVACNKVASLKGRLPIKEDGIFGAATCGALAFCLNEHNAELRSVLDDAYTAEGIAVCNAKDPKATWVYPAQDPNAVVVPTSTTPPVVDVPPPVVSQPTPAAPEVPAPSPSPGAPAWTTDGGQSQILYTTSPGGSTVLPNLDITGDLAPKTGISKGGLLAIATLAAAAGLGTYLYFRKK